MKIRARKFDGRCGKHKRYNPAIDGVGGIRGACPRCGLLFEIWQKSLELNRLIRKFDPSHNDLDQPKPALEPDPRQMTLI